jgi:hypothetical protein
MIAGRQSGMQLGCCNGTADATPRMQLRSSGTSLAANRRMFRLSGMVTTNRILSSLPWGLPLIRQLYVPPIEREAQHSHYPVANKSHVV